MTVIFTTSYNTPFPHCYNNSAMFLLFFLNVCTVLASIMGSISFVVVVFVRLFSVSKIKVISAID